MTKDEAKLKIREMLASGQKRADVFRELQGQEIDDRMLAIFIAECPDPARVKKYRNHAYVIIAILLLSILLTVYNVNVTAEKMYSESSFVSLIFMYVCPIVVPLLITLGIYKNWPGAYRALILLNIFYLFISLVLLLTMSFSGSVFFSKLPRIDDLIVDILAAIIIIYFWIVYKKLFPDLGLIEPKSINNEFVFTENENNAPSEK